MTSFVFESDAIPETWQFLNGLRRDDLIAELLQNELDAGSTYTKIHFEQDRLVCEGNGEPIDEDGWTRLRFFRGAGDLAPRKHSKTGVKNHGLKACFTIGDDIIIRSAGRFTQQTLYSPERAPKPYPGAMSEPEDDPTAPEVGCRVEVQYRKSELHIDVGEPLTFSALSAEDTNALFDAACAELPQRFLGVVRPGLRSRYKVEVSHWKYGTKLFLFSARSRSKSRRGIFTRSCRVERQNDGTTETLREQAYLVSLPASIAGTHEIPEFYQRPGGFYAEVSWCIDSRGHPIYVPGQLRYPIAYVGRGARAASGICASYSAPFVSDAERHGISEQTDFNGETIRRCDEALVKVLRDELLPLHGPSVLSLVCNDDIEQERRREFLQLLLKHRGIPIAGKSRQGARVRLLRETRATSEWSFVIPCSTSDRTRVSEHLAGVCPRGHKQLHPKTPSTVIHDLAENVYDDRSISNNESSRFTTFDENEVVSLLKRDTADQCEFPWNDKCEQQFSKASQAKLILDVLYEIDKKMPLDDSDRDEIKQAWEVPNDSGSRSLLGELFFSRELTEFPPTVNLPALIHRDLRDHRLFRRRKWKLRSFGVAEMLESVDLEEHSESVRRRFWEWTRKNWRRIPQRHRREFAALPIWPTVDGQYVALPELCYPKRRDVRNILRSVLRVPTSAMLRLAGVRVGGRGTLRIRATVSQDDLNAWFTERQNPFHAGEVLNESQRRDFQMFEADVAALAKDRQLAALLGKLESEAFGLDQSGVLRRCVDLHRETEAIRALCLRPEDLILRALTQLDHIFAPRTEPSTGALRRAMQNPPTELATLRVRLAAYVKASEREGTSSLIDNLKCIPIDGKWWIPTELALQGRRGDFWGAWKKTIQAKGRSADEQAILRTVGVASGEPTANLSRGFFEWLQEADVSSPAQNLQRVVRHFEHPNGVLSWWEEYPDTPCVPVLDGESLWLASLSQVLNPKSRICIDDFPELAVQMRELRSDVVFVIDRHPKLPVSIVDRIRAFDIKRLHRLAGGPIQVEAMGEVESDAELCDVLIYLQTREFRKEMRSRLAQWDIPVEHLRNDWFDRVSSIRQIAVCTEVVATFQIRRQVYHVSMASQLDETSGVLYVVGREGDKLSALFDAISAYVFRGDAPRMAKAAFEKAVLTELPKFEDLSLDSHEDSFDEEMFDDGEESDSREGVTEAQTTHGSHAKNRNMPQPQELSQSRQKSTRTTGTSSDGRGSSSRTRLPSNVEDKHKQQLKETYAWHCQVCLATRCPECTGSA